MSTYTQILYHIVFATKNREPVLDPVRHEDFFRYVWGIVKGKNSHLYRINAVDDHVHILTSLHPAVALADFVKDIKLGSSSWIRREGVFPRFRHWQDGYGAFTASYDAKEALTQYIRDQKEHHRKVTFKEEMRRLLEKAGVAFEEKHLV